MEIIDNRKKIIKPEDMVLGEVYEIIIDDPYEGGFKNIVMVIEESEKSVDPDNILLLNLYESVAFEVRPENIINITPLNAKIIID